MVCATLLPATACDETDLDLTVGMFLWARLVLDYLTTNIFHSRHEITTAIDTLPRKLSEL